LTLVDAEGDDDEEDEGLYGPLVVERAAPPQASRPASVPAGPSGPAVAAAAAAVADAAAARSAVAPPAGAVVSTAPPAGAVESAPPATATGGSASAGGEAGAPNAHESSAVLDTAVGAGPAARQKVAVAAPAVTQAATAQHAAGSASHSVLRRSPGAVQAAGSGLSGTPHKAPAEPGWVAEAVLETAAAVSATATPVRLPPSAPPAEVAHPAPSAPPAAVHDVPPFHQQCPRAPPAAASSEVVSGSGVRSDDRVPSRAAGGYSAPAGRAPEAGHVTTAAAAAAAPPPPSDAMAMFAAPRERRRAGVGRDGVASGIGSGGAAAAAAATQWLASRLSRQQRAQLARGAEQAAPYARAARVLLTRVAALLLALATAGVAWLVFLIAAATGDGEGGGGAAAAGGVGGGHIPMARAVRLADGSPAPLQSLADIPTAQLAVAREHGMQPARPPQQQQHAAARRAGSAAAASCERCVAAGLRLLCAWDWRPAVQLGGAACSGLPSVAARCAGRLTAAAQRSGLLERLPPGLRQHVASGWQRIALTDGAAPVFGGGAGASIDPATAARDGADVEGLASRRDTPGLEVAIPSVALLAQRYERRLKHGGRDPHDEEEAEEEQGGGGGAEEGRSGAADEGASAARGTAAWALTAGAGAAGSGAAAASGNASHPAQRRGTAAASAAATSSSRRPAWDLESIAPQQLLDDDDDK
jgi:hypothetical protein